MQPKATEYCFALQGWWGLWYLKYLELVKTYRHKIWWLMVIDDDADDDDDGDGDDDDDDEKQ